MGLCCGWWAGACSNRQSVFATTGSGGLAGAITNIFGSKVMKGLQAIRVETDAVTIAGYVSNLESGRSSNDRQLTFLNKCVAWLG